MKNSIKKIKQLFIEALYESRREQLLKKGKMIIVSHIAELSKYPLSAVQYKNDSERLEKHLIPIADNEYGGSIAEALRMHELFLQRIGAWSWISLVPFYLGLGHDNKSRMIDDILSWDSERLENIHDYIQWLFPLQEKSASNSLAPILTKEEVSEFRSNPILRAKILESFNKLMEFYGFVCRKEKGALVIVRSDKFKRQSHNWLTKHNHNFLRITRILKCLMLLGLEEYAQTFMTSLEKVYNDYQQVIGEETISYWRKSI